MRTFLLLPCLLAFAAVATAANAPVAGDWIALFDGRTLDGWVVRGGKSPFRAEAGMIVGTTASEPGPNTFLCTEREFADFDLEFDVRCDRELNSGVQIRSHIFTRPTPQASQPDRIRAAGEVYGYQCEIPSKEERTAGNFWDEARWTKWHDDLATKPGAGEAFRPGEWNHFRIVAQGDRIRSWVNGVACADFTDTLDRTGFIGLQVHRMKLPPGKSFEVRWKNIRLRVLPTGESVQ